MAKRRKKARKGKRRRSYTAKARKRSPRRYRSNPKPVARRRKYKRNPRNPLLDIAIGTGLGAAASIGLDFVADKMDLDAKVRSWGLLAAGVGIAYLGRKNKMALGAGMGIAVVSATNIAKAYMARDMAGNPDYAQALEDQATSEMLGYDVSDPSNYINTENMYAMQDEMLGEQVSLGEQVALNGNFTNPGLNANVSLAGDALNPYDEDEMAMA